MLSKNFEYTGQRLYLLEHRLADELRAGFGDRVAQQKLLALELAEAQPFVPHAAFVGGFGRAGEPALVDAAAMGAVGVPIVGMQLDPLAGMQKRPRHPGGREPQQALRRRRVPDPRCRRRCRALALSVSTVAMVSFEADLAIGLTARRL